jgi:hypothetical protein
MEIVTKSLPMELVPVDEPEDAHPGTFHAIISSQRTDRDGDQLWADEWEQPLPDHVVINGDHDNNHIMSIVGSGQPQLEADRKVHVRGSYAETDFAQDTRKLVNGKHLRTLSCAYREKRGEKGVRRELVNASFVVVPSNVDCVVVESKSHDLQIESNIPEKRPTPLDVKMRKAGDDVVKTFVALTQKELQAMTPQQRVQAIHDMSNELGSQCQYYDGSPLVDGKTFGSTEVVFKWEPTAEELQLCTPTVTLSEDKKSYVLQINDADGRNVFSQDFSAPEAPSPEADHLSADREKEKALALADARFKTFTANSFEEGS